MADLHLLQQKQDYNDKKYSNFLNQLYTIDSILEKKDENYTIKLLEKQFLNKDLFKNWINNFSYNKLQVLNKKDEDLFGIQLTFVIKILLFFRNLNLITDDNLQLINTIIDNSELFSRFIFTDCDKFCNIIKNSSNYIFKNKDLSIVNTFTNLNNKKEDIKEQSHINNIVNDNVKLNINTNNLKADQKNTVQHNKSNLLEKNVNILNENYIQKDCNKEESVPTSEKSYDYDKSYIIPDIPKTNENTDELKKPDILEPVNKCRKKYTKKDKGLILKNTVHNIINNRIKNEELYNSLYKFNRNNILLFSDIYKKYKINCSINDTEFEEISRNFDKNKCRFLKICKIYHSISEDKLLLNSKLLFLPYCFNDMPAKEESLYLFKMNIIEYINNLKSDV